MQVALGVIALAQTKGTQDTARACAQLLDYVATNPDARIRYHKSDMILHLHSNESYLSEWEAKYRAGGIHYLSYKREDTKPSKQDETLPPLNGAIHIVCEILSNVMSLAMEA